MDDDFKTANYFLYVEHQNRDTEPYLIGFKDVAEIEEYLKEPVECGYYEDYDYTLIEGKLKNWSMAVTKVKIEVS